MATEHARNFILIHKIPCTAGSMYKLRLHWEGVSARMDMLQIFGSETKATQIR